MNLEEKIEPKVIKIQDSVWYKNLSFWNVIVLTATFIVLCIYACDTHIIALSTQLTREDNLRPVILRNRSRIGWDSLVPQLNSQGSFLIQSLEFQTLKNIATDIKGHVIINGNKYNLRWHNENSQIGKNQYAGFEKWGWLPENGSVYAFCDPNSQQKSKETNQIVILYKDIEENLYCTIEDSNGRQFSLKSNDCKKYLI